MGSRVTLSGELMFPNDFLSAPEFKGRDVTLTVRSVSMEDLQMKGGKKEKKPVLLFVETKKKLVINKTNADSIATMYGTVAEQWAGKRVTFYPTKTKFGRETVDCIRVRETVPPTRAAASVPPTSVDHGRVEDHGADADSGGFLNGSDQESVGA